MGDATVLEAGARPPGRPGRRVDRVTLTQSAVSLLRDMIVSGEIPAGAPLRLDEIAIRLEMSISPIREALRQLEVLGLVEHRAYRGASVTQLSLSEMLSVYESRLALEVVVIRRLASGGLDSDAELMLNDFLDDMAAAYEACDRFAVVRTNTDFHLALADLTGSGLYHRLMRQIHTVWERYSGKLIAGDRPEDTFEAESAGHRAILDALRRSDPDAAELALRSHLLVSRDIFRQVATYPAAPSSTDAEAVVARND